MSDTDGHITDEALAELPTPPDDCGDRDCGECAADRCRDMVRYLRAERTARLAIEDARIADLRVVEAAVVALARVLDRGEETAGCPGGVCHAGFDEDRDHDTQFCGSPECIAALIAAYKEGEKAHE